MTNKLLHLEETLNRISSILLYNQESSNDDNYSRDGYEGKRQIVSSKTTKLEFPQFLGNDLT